MKFLLILLLLLCFGSVANAAIPGLSSSTAGGFGSGAASAQPSGTITAPLGSLSTASIYKLCGGGSGTAFAFYGLYSGKGRVDSSTFPIPANQALRVITVEVETAAGSGAVFNFGWGSQVLGSEGALTQPIGKVNAFGSATTGGSFTVWNASYIPNVWSGLGIDLGSNSQVYLWVSSTSTSAFTFCIQGTIQ